MSNTIACVTLNAMCAVCGAHCATWVGEDEHGNREYTLDCLDEDGQRYIVNHSDLPGAVCELAVVIYHVGEAIVEQLAEDLEKAQSHSKAA